MSMDSARIGLGKGATKGFASNAHGATDTPTHLVLVVR